ncbi:hypothetical protein LSM04_005294 [Trypanosoma melophagium]|uniref:uncharacterized protein n=1 Tax=Trypanosoma melophagium TaxID=715481 RepID=UPI00351A528B|nr:hypothetical protein LSM04_005294 [Trypanosoma melophagium]
MRVKYNVSYNESQKLLLPRRSSVQPKRESPRRFRGSHLVEFENGELVSIDAAICCPGSADQGEFIEFLTKVRRVP